MESCAFSGLSVTEPETAPLSCRADLQTPGCQEKHQDRRRRSMPDRPRNSCTARKIAAVVSNSGRSCSRSQTRNRLLLRFHCYRVFPGGYSQVNLVGRIETVEFSECGVVDDGKLEGTYAP